MPCFYFSIMIFLVVPILLFLAWIRQRYTKKVEFSADKETTIPKGFVLTDIEGRRYRTQSKLNLKPVRVGRVTVERI